MKVYLIYFSPGGSTLRAMKNVASGMKDVEMEWIDMSIPANRKKKYIFTSDDLVVYGTLTGGMLFSPNREIFSVFEGHGAAFAGFAQYGNGYYGVAVKQLKRRAESASFNVVGLGAFVGQYSLSSHYATGRPDSKDADIQRQFGQTILAKAKAKNYRLSVRPHVGWAKKTMGNIVVFVRQFMMNSDYTLPPSMKGKRYTSHCIECGKCESNCPMGAINLKTRTFDLGKCISCYRCINQCPKQAIEVTNKMMRNIGNDFDKMAGAGIRRECEVFV